VQFVRQKFSSFERLEPTFSNAQRQDFHVRNLRSSFH
jgi:hypothetical protein